MLQVEIGTTSARQRGYSKLLASPSTSWKGLKGPKNPLTRASQLLNRALYSIYRNGIDRDESWSLCCDGFSDATKEGTRGGLELPPNPLPKPLLMRTSLYPLPPFPLSPGGGGMQKDMCRRPGRGWKGEKIKRSGKLKVKVTQVALGYSPESSEKFPNSFQHMWLGWIFSGKEKMKTQMKRVYYEQVEASPVACLRSEIWTSSQVEFVFFFTFFIFCIECAFFNYYFNSVFFFSKCDLISFFN